MAYKTVTQVMTLTQRAVALACLVDLICDGALVVAYNLNKQAISPDGVDDAPEDASMISALNGVASMAGALRESINGYIRSTYAAWGRLGGCPNLNDLFLCLDYAAEYLRAQNKQIQRRGFNFPSSATVNGTFAGSGAGKAAIYTTDLAGQLIDVGHVDNIVLECIKDASQGATPGREEFAIRGGLRDFPWQEGGIGNAGGSYNHPYGRVPGDMIATASGQGQGGVVPSGGRLFVTPATNGVVNKILNGDCEQAISGTGLDKIPEWTIAGTATNLSEETTAPINKTRNYYFTANDKISQPIATGKLTAGKAYGISAKALRTAGGSTAVTGVFTVKVMDRDGGATHGTLTLDVSTLTHATRTNLTPVIFLLPNSAKELKIEVELASLGGDGTNKQVHFDDICVAEASLVDGHWVILMDGQTASSGNQQGMFRRGDKFTIAVTSTDAGKNQLHYANRAAGRYLPNDTAADTGFEDGDAVADIAVFDGASDDPADELADTDSVDTGTASAGSHAVTLRVRNRGLIPLLLEVPTDANASNCSLTTPGLTRPRLVNPGEYFDLAMVIDDGGAGAWSIDIVLASNDPDTDPFTVTIEGTAT